MNEPMLRTWIHESGKPGGVQKERSGFWVGENDWPSSNMTSEHFFLHQNGMSAKAQSDTKKMIHHSPLDAFAETGVWFPMGIDGDFPEDQSEIGTGLKVRFLFSFLLIILVDYLNIFKL